MDLTFASMIEIGQAVRTKKVSATEVATHYLERIRRLDPQLNSFITINEAAVDEARAIDGKIQKGEDPGPLAGVPFGIKDLFCTKGLKTTAASKILGNFVPPYESTVTERLKAAGIVTMGKLNLDEFAMGSSNETSAYGPVKNPWKTDRVPGGSSGGSAAAMAARLVAGTLGTDTGGSIRQPASFCGVVGVKPTYGRVSRYGIVAYASSLDQAGPMVGDVRDAALILELISGRDGRDSTLSEKPAPTLLKDLNPNLKGMKIGILKESMSDALDADVQKSVQRALDMAKASGAEIIEVSAPLTEHAIPIYYLIATSEASSNLARYDGVKYGFRAEFGNLSALDLDQFYAETRGQGFGKEVKRRIMLGTYCLSSGYYDAYYSKACQVRRLLKNQYDDIFKTCDVLLSPVSTHPAFPLGGRISDPLAMYLNDIFTVSTNLAGLPGMSLPFGLSKEGLPIGLQITAGAYQEQKMFNAAAAFEAMSEAKGAKPHVI